MFIALCKCCGLPWWCFAFAWMTLCFLFTLVYTSARGKATCDELWFFMWLSLLSPVLLWWLSVYVKGTKQILVVVCIVEFTCLHSNFLVCKLQFYTVKLTVCSVNVFTVFLYFLQNYSGNHSCQNYFVKTTEYFLQCSCEISLCTTKKVILLLPKNA